jgi:hypothetical protein
VGRAGAGPQRERKGKGEIGRPRVGGEEEKWAEPETGREKRNPFPFSKFMFCSNLLKRISKTNLNRKNSTQQNMQQHECTSTCLGLIVNFNSIKIHFLLYLSAHNN